LFPKSRSTASDKISLHIQRGRKVVFRETDLGQMVREFWI
jgi:hypothetical protein